MKRSTKIVTSTAISVALLATGSGVANACAPKPQPKGISSWTQTSKPHSSTLGKLTSVASIKPTATVLLPNSPVGLGQPPTKPTVLSVPVPKPCAKKSTPPKVSSPSSPTHSQSAPKVTTPASIVPPAPKGSTGTAVAVAFTKPVTPPSTVSNAPIKAAAKIWPMAAPSGSLAQTGSDTGVLTEIALTLLTLGVVLLIVTASKPRNNVIFTSPEITASAE